jgi:hypothetical protein
MTIDWLFSIIGIAVGVVGAFYWVRKMKSPRLSMAKALGVYLLIVAGGGIAAFAGLFALFWNRDWFDPALPGTPALVAVMIVIIVLLLLLTKRLISR